MEGMVEGDIILATETVYKAFFKKINQYKLSSIDQFFLNSILPIHFDNYFIIIEDVFFATLFSTLEYHDRIILVFTYWLEGHSNHTEN